RSAGDESILETHPPVHIRSRPRGLSLGGRLAAIRLRAHGRPRRGAGPARRDKRLFFRPVSGYAILHAGLRAGTRPAAAGTRAVSLHGPPPGAHDRGGLSPQPDRLPAERVPDAVLRLPPVGRGSRTHGGRPALQAP